MTRVKLLWVEGDAESYADIIGASGTLKEVPRQGLRFTPDDHNDWVVMTARKQTTDDNGRLRIETTLDNVFVFKPLPEKLT